MRNNPENSKDYLLLTKHLHFIKIKQNKSIWLPKNIHFKKEDMYNFIVNIVLNKSFKCLSISGSMKEIQN